MAGGIFITRLKKVQEFTLNTYFCEQRYKIRTWQLKRPFTYFPNNPPLLGLPMDDGTAIMEFCAARGPHIMFGFCA